MAEPKTRPTSASVAAFLATIRQSERQRDARAVAAMMRAATGARATMWGPTIIGFGRHPITGSTGRTSEWPVAAFAPRSTGLVVYFMDGFLARHPLLPRLGKHRVGKSCLYIRTHGQTGRGRPVWGLGPVKGTGKLTRLSNVR